MRAEKNIQRPTYNVVAQFEDTLLQNITSCMNTSAVSTTRLYSQHHVLVTENFSSTYNFWLF